MPIVSRIADRWRVGGIFEDGHDIDRDKSRSGKQAAVARGEKPMRP